MVSTSYCYALRRDQLDRLLELKRVTGVPVARQLDYAVDLLLAEYDWDSEEFSTNLKTYLTREQLPSRRRR